MEAGVKVEQGVADAPLHSGRTPAPWARPAGGGRRRSQ